MTNSDDLPTIKRLTVTITNSSVDDLELLRSLLEKQTNKRFSIAQVVKQLVKEKLAAVNN